MFEVKAAGEVMFVQQHVRVSMFRHFFFQLSHQVIVFIKELGIFLNFTLGFADFGKVVFIVTVIFDEGVVFLVVDFKHDDGVGEL